jgi:hypothetical protein
MNYEEDCSSFYRHDGLSPSMRIYSLKNLRLNWASLLSGDRGSFTLNIGDVGISLVELPDASLLVAGGLFWTNLKYNLVWRVDVRRDFALIDKPPMQFSRFNHQLVYLSDFVYAIGGNTEKCERFQVSTECWETLPEIPLKLCLHSAIASALTQSIYVFGGRSPLFVKFDTVFMFSIATLTWERLAVKLPAPDYSIPVFRLPTTSASVYLVNGAKLYAFSLHKQRLKLKSKLQVHLQSMSACCYFNEALYYSNDLGFIGTFNLGRI